MNDPVVKQLNQPHARIVIRNKVKELLKASVDVAGRVFCSRPKSVFLTELPCVLIYFNEENESAESSAPRIYKRDLTLVIELVHSLESERDNALDDFLDSRAFEVEAIMLQDRFIGLRGIVEDCQFTRTENMNIEIDGADDIASTKLMFSITYRTDAFYGGRLDEFLKFLTDYNEPNGLTLAQDSVVIREE